jgi:hypothetical protein
MIRKIDINLVCLNSIKLHFITISFETLEFENFNYHSKPCFRFNNMDFVNNVVVVFYILIIGFMASKTSEVSFAIRFQAIIPQ